MILTASVDVVLSVRVSWDKREWVGTIQFKGYSCSVGNWECKSWSPLLSTLERLPSGVVLSLAVWCVVVLDQSALAILSWEAPANRNTFRGRQIGGDQCHYTGAPPVVVWECFEDVCDPASCRKILTRSYCREGSFITQIAKLSTPLIT